MGCALMRGLVQPSSKPLCLVSWLVGSRTLRVPQHLAYLNTLYRGKPPMACPSPQHRRGIAKSASRGKHEAHMREASHCENHGLMFAGLHASAEHTKHACGWCFLSCPRLEDNGTGMSRQYLLPLTATLSRPSPPCVGCRSGRGQLPQESASASIVNLN